MWLRIGQEQQRHHRKGRMLEGKRNRKRGEEGSRRDAEKRWGKGRGGESQGRKRKAGGE
jgi:hypothetical protein